MAEGIVKRTPNSVEGQEFYIPHKGVLLETAESTKLRILYDASARAWDSVPSLNESLNTGSPLQNQLWSVLIRGHFNPIAITGDIKKAFLQVRIRPEERDALRFHWLKSIETKEIETLHSTRRVAVDNGGSTRMALGPTSKMSSEVNREKMPRMQTLPGHCPCCTASWTTTVRSS